MVCDQWLGPYRVLDEIGRGATGRVFVAERRGTLELVAVKVLRDAASVQARLRFQRESRILQQLPPHKNILARRDVDMGGNPPYIAMEFIPTRLDDLPYRCHPLAVAYIGLGLANAVAHMHDYNYIHRDLKPGNILLRDGDPVIADFGLARPLDGPRGGPSALDAITEEHVFAGTPRYAAPEHLDPVEPKATERSDIYAIGTILYEMLTGDVPDLRYRMWSEPPSVLWACEHGDQLGLFAALDPIVRRCQRKAPRRRFGTAAALAERLNDCVGSRRKARASILQLLRGHEC